MAILNDNGLIILHDLNPLQEKYQITPMSPEPTLIWNGDCWKVGIALRLINELEIVVGDFDHGVGILKKRPNRHPLPQNWIDRIFKYMSEHVSSETFLESIPFAEFRENVEVLFRLMTVEEIKSWLDE